MGEALLIPFGLNLLSSAAFEVLATRVRESIWPKRKPFLAAVSQHLRRAAEFDISPDLLNQVLFDNDVFSAVLRREPASSSWDNLLFDLLPPSGVVDGQQLATLLYEAVISQGGIDVQMVLVDGINDLKDGQGVIYAELLELRRLVEDALAASATESATVHQSINDHLSKVHAAIASLTDEQMYVIRTLHGVKRALVPGAAGSGKTVVACEKALRLTDAGISTLLLCHNPLLARHLEEMTKGSLVEVRSFGEWVAALTGDSETSSDEWQRHEEPSETTIWQAFEHLLEPSAGWQAIIVDEGQDFRTDWWLLVDAAVDSSSGLLYVFTDDFQQVHGAGREYPRFDQSYALSRNCRNSGSVYRAMRTLVPGLSRHEESLADFGFTTVVLTDPGLVVESLGRSAQEMHGVSGDESVVVLTMDGRVDAVRSANPRVAVEPPVEWRSGVVSAVTRLFEESRSYPGLAPANSDDMTPLGQLYNLSYDITPSQEDARLVSRVAQILISRTPHHNWDARAHPVRFQVDGSQIALSRTAPHHWRARVKYLASIAWVNDVPSPDTLALKAYSEPGSASSGEASVHTIAGFKGLEADTVLVVWEPQLSPKPLTELYVAVSRARLGCVVTAPSTARSQLPGRLLERATVVEI